MAVLREAAVVGATLSFSGSSALAALGNHFDVVIIDEAAQAVEPSTLIPLVTGCKQVGTGHQHTSVYECFTLGLLGKRGPRLHALGSCCVSVLPA